MKSLKSLKDKLEINERFTRPSRNKTEFNKVKDIVAPIPDYNLQADLLHLPLDKKTGSKYLLVITDLANNDFDIEPLKTTSSDESLEALQKIFKRNYVKQPKASLSTDGGSEFQDVFHKYLAKNNIYHKISKAGRHTQQANVENLNKTLARLINGYMNAKEEKHGKKYNNWVEAIPLIREDLNKYRHINLPKDINKIPRKQFNDVGDIIKITDKDIIRKHEQYNKENGIKEKLVFHKQIQAKFKPGDLVHVKLDKPENSFGIQQNTENFRAGDYRFSKSSQPIESVLYMNTPPYFRYLVKTYDGVSYSENQLLKSKDKVEKYRIESIQGTKIINGIKHYKIRWAKPLTAKDDSYESETNLIADGQQNFINLYNDRMKGIHHEDEEFEVEKIVGKKTTRGIIYYKIKWLGYDDSENTWETKEELVKDGLTSMIKKYEKSI